MIIPAYNEEKTIGRVIDRLKKLPLDLEIIVVDDGSSDGTAAQAREEGAVLIRHDRNQGKGGALHTGFSRASGDVFVVQDADLEYYPEDLVGMMDVLEKEGHPVLFGSRNLGFRMGFHTGRGRAAYYWGGRLVGWVCNILYGTRLTDEPTCYKMFRREVLDGFRLKCKGFAFCAELCARLSLARIPIREVPIRYAPRTRREGKKLKAWDGLYALLVLVAIRIGVY